MQVAPELENGILLHTKERLMRTYRQMSTPFFAELHDAKINHAAALSTLERYSSGSVICRRGETGRAFYVVVSGVISVT